MLADALEHGAADDQAEALTLQAEPADQTVQRRGEHVLIGGMRICLVGASERNAIAANNGDGARGPTGFGGALRRTGFRCHSSLQVSWGMCGAGRVAVVLALACLARTRSAPVAVVYNKLTLE
ncbi:hypothetical protein GCM10023318_14140 [Nocardia callitridis]|uniref:Uncharacterized protein n=1 Tax=Nocardia callitridis TaxID=648753 RepID=A0ABP9K2D1_9NOCA